MSTGSWGANADAAWKQQEDYSKETAELLKRVNASEIPVLLRSTTRPLTDYIQELLDMEKKARFGGDTFSTRKLAVESVRIFRMLGKTDDMVAMIDVLFRKRAQMKLVQTSLIAEASLMLGDGPIYAESTAPPEGSEAPGERAKTDGPTVKGADYEALLGKLRFQCEGKIHLELEHARFTSRIARLRIEAGEGGKKEASDMLAGIQIETITNMPRLEKIQSVLKQIRLALELGDDARLIILSRKLNPRALAKDDTRTSKMQYFFLMSEYYAKHKQYLPMARCWHEIFFVLQQNADGQSDGAARAVPASATAAPSAFLEFTNNSEGVNNLLPASMSTVTAVSNTALLALMAPHITTKELDDQMEFCAFAKSTAFASRLDLLRTLQKERTLRTEVDKMAQLIDVFMSQELIRVATSPQVEDLAAHHQLLRANPERREALSARLSEHDLLVISRFYTRARIERLAELVGLSVERTEHFIMELVDAKELFARFDRVAGVVTFEQSHSKPSTLLAEWTKQVDSTAALVEKAAQLISKERMVQAAQVVRQ